MEDSAVYSSVTVCPLLISPVPLWHIGNSPRQGVLQSAALDPPPCTSREAHAHLSGAILILQGQGWRLHHPHPFQLTRHSPLEPRECVIAVEWSQGKLQLLPAPCAAQLLPLFPVFSPCACR